MLYYSDEARQSAIDNISELIVKIGTIPGNYLDYTSARELTNHLTDLQRIISKEKTHE